MTNREIKESILEAIHDNTSWFKPVTNEEYRTRCPFCGDSTTNPNIGKFYILANYETNLPIVYNCFRCGESGVMNEEVLSAFGIDDTTLKSGIVTLIKTSDKVKHHKYMNNTKVEFFDYKLPKIKRHGKECYVENRLGVSFTDEDLINLKMVTSLKDFLRLNNIKEITCPLGIANMIEDHYVGFLSYGNSYILFRDVTEKEKFSWIKYPITKESRGNKIFYSISSSVDIYSTEPITINLSEGVLDIISASYNLGYNKHNTLNIACGGKRYDTILHYLTSIGLVGDNITLNIFSDNDEKFNKSKNNVPTTVEFFKKNLYKFKHLYGKVNIYYNILGKDIGVRKENISLKRERI